VDARQTHSTPRGVVHGRCRAQPGYVGASGEGSGGCERQAEVLVTIHGRVFTGTLRRGGRLPGQDEWRWWVEIRVDDRRVMTWVAADQVEFVEPRGSDGA
jgi:hypothetical protein